MGLGLFGPRHIPLHGRDGRQDRGKCLPTILAGHFGRRVSGLKRKKRDCRSRNLNAHSRRSKKRANRRQKLGSRRGGIAKDGRGGRGRWDVEARDWVMVLPYNKSRDAELSVFFPPSPQTRDPALEQHPISSIINHHGWPQDFVGADPLHFQSASEAQHGFNLVVRAARLPH